MKLNLGCGDKILEGYVNVDVAASRAGKRPDVLCDLHALTPFQDDAVDEILSVHVVEHFWRWEVVGVLKEWLRVLKPGGVMILECPNLKAACEAFLADPELHSGPGKEGQQSMWVFYGDPAWRDPLMVHRWGYTPRSLAHVMHEAGLVNLRQEPAQFKLRDPRDMRVVGEKPVPAGRDTGTGQRGNAAAGSFPDRTPVDGGAMRALWFVTAGVRRLATGTDTEQALLSSPVASTRMRTAVAALELRRGGHENSFWTPGPMGPGEEVDWTSVNVCVVPKFHFDTPPEPWYEACRSARNAGCPLVLDVCEYPFKDDPAARKFYEGIRAFYSEALKICDAVVVNSERMAELMAPHVSRRPVVIEDAILGPSRNIEFAPAGRLRLLWYGHGTNLRYLDNCVASLVRFAARKPCRLTIVSDGGFGAREVTQAMDARFAPALEARFVEWSLESMAASLRRCDLVLIPSDPSDQFKAGVSANRIGEALRAGRFPVASPLPAYLPFSEAAWLGDDLTEGIQWALANPGETRTRIRRGQALVGERLAPEAVGPRWRALLESLARPNA